jgi:Integrase core domain
MAGRISMSARREVKAAVVERYRSAGRSEKGRILDELCKVTGWHRKHAVRALSVPPQITPDGPLRRQPTYGATIKDALVALWEASDRICGKRLKVMIPTLLPALERHGRLKLGKTERSQVLAVSAATIDRLLVNTKIAAAGGKRRRVGFYSAVRREVPIRTFNDWNDPAPGFCEVDMVAHGGTSVAGSFIQTLTMVDVATGWTECMPLVTRESGLVVQAMERAQSLFPWLVLGADFDNDSAFMNDVVVPWCRSQKIEVTRSRAYKKNDQAFIEQKNGAVVRRLVGYGRFEGTETARILVRLYAASRLHTNFFQPSFKLKDKRREGAKVIKRYHAPATPYARALAHPKVSKAVKTRLRELYRTLDPVALLAKVRAAQAELGTRINGRAGKIAASPPSPAPDVATFAKGLGDDVARGEQRDIHRHLRKAYKTRVRMPSMLDPHLQAIERWLEAEPRITALVILGRLAACCPNQFGPPQHSVVQRLLKTLRRKAAGHFIDATEPLASVRKPPGPTCAARRAGNISS